MATYNSIVWAFEESVKDYDTHLASCNTDEILGHFGRVTDDPDATRTDDAVFNREWSVQELARLWSVNTSFVIDAIRCGKLRAFKVDHILNTGGNNGKGKWRIPDECRLKFEKSLGLVSI